MYPEELKYTQDHEWLRAKKDTGTVGITYHAQHQLGDVVFVELPEEGEEFGPGEAFGVVESVKTVSDLYMPVQARVIKVNERLLDEPELVNEDPYGEGWMLVVEIDADDLDSLMSADEYRAMVEAE